MRRMTEVEYQRARIMVIRGMAEQAQAQIDEINEQARAEFAAEVADWFAMIRHRVLLALFAVAAIVMIVSYLVH